MHSSGCIRVIVVPRAEFSTVETSLERSDVCVSPIPRSRIDPPEDPPSRRRRRVYNTHCSRTYPPMTASSVPLPRARRSHRRRRTRPRFVGESVVHPFPLVFVYRSHPRARPRDGDRLVRHPQRPHASRTTPPLQRGAQRRTRAAPWRLHRPRIASTTGQNARIPLNTRTRPRARFVLRFYLSKGVCFFSRIEDTRTSKYKRSKKTEEEPTSRGEKRVERGKNASRGGTRRRRRRRARARTRRVRLGEGRTAMGRESRAGAGASRFDAG